MERLTFEGNFCDIAQCRELPCPHGGNCTQKQVWERLARYEDAGLTPAEVLSMHSEWSAMMSVLNSADTDISDLLEAAGVEVRDDGAT